MSGIWKYALGGVALFVMLLIGGIGMQAEAATACSAQANLAAYDLRTACPPNWTLVDSPNPLSNNYLNGVAAVGPNDVWAVGSYYDYNNGSLGGTLMLHWNGTAWTQVPGAGGTIDHQGYLNAVAAVASNDVWAVGYYCPGTACQTLIEHWNGTQWSVVSSPNRPGYNELKGVAVISATDVWAVGYSAGNHHTLTEHWNGQAWIIVPSPPASDLYNYILTSVSALAGNNVWAVGYMEGQSG